MTSTVYIAKTVYGGDGLGRLGDGRVVFVPGAFAGEQVRAEIVEEKAHFVKARLVEVVEASPERIESTDVAVPGMVYANLSYKGECAAKEQQLREFFERARIVIGEEGDAGRSARRADPTGDGRLTADDRRMPLNYRNKVVYHFAKQGGSWVIGYRKEPSHEIVDVAVDPLARPEINVALPEIRRNVMTLLTTGPIAVRRDTERKENVTIRWTKKTGVKWWIGEAPKDLFLKETTYGRDFEVSADGFYQVNPEVGEELVRTVVEEYARGADATPDILDLYCGVGVFGLCCLTKAPAGAHLTGVESGRLAIDCARRNASSLNSTSIRFYSEQVERNMRRLPLTMRTTVIVDPPRGGLMANVTKGLADSRAGRILYVSCDPATLIRDLKTLTRTFAVESVRWFNMFPRTARFETLVALKRRS